MSPSENDAKVKASEGSSARTSNRAGPVGTIKVRIVPLETPEATAAAIGHLVEEWAALTYSCMVEAAMVAPAANEPMHPLDDAAAGAVEADVGLE
ncbi:hypothetical protein [Anaeromyxobacter soli]|uniref:hypothetical protein n=1 Tax=Anaeromyxobacter soli TaxID=2922725 RepID=UPI001FAFA664|nr:hypothetical protein [Anaeromyxobacter sp. SG29]